MDQFLYIKILKFLLTAVAMRLKGIHVKQQKITLFYIEVH